MSTPFDLDVSFLPDEADQVGNHALYLAALEDEEIAGILLACKYAAVDLPDGGITTIVKAYGQAKFNTLILGAALQAVDNIRMDIEPTRIVFHPGDNAPDGVEDYVINL